MKRLAMMSAALLTGVAAARAEDHVWIIGGGPYPDHSQVQIEINVNFVLDTLREQQPAAQTHVYFADGNSPGADIKLEVADRADARSGLQPLARVFDQQFQDASEYRNHEVAPVAGGTEAAALAARLREEFARLKAGDRALIIFNGHGLRGEKDAAENTLRLWNDTEMTVRELEGLLGQIQPAVPVRFVMTQCYSGGFARLIRPGADDVTGLAAGNRCGFMAEAEDRESEGCTASVDIGDYRDYTTYFFAALRGQTVLGEPLPVNPDEDEDGAVTLREAHHYVLNQAHNADLPRATSEVYLERWQPWYLRWIDTGGEPDNEFGTLARELAAATGLPPSGRALISELDARRRDHARQIAELDSEDEVLGPGIRELQHAMQQDLVMLWPALDQPYTHHYRELLADGTAAVQAAIVADPRYERLVAMQARRDSIETELLYLDRDSTRLDRIRRLRKLARLRAQFERHASAREREEFSRLSRCEQQPL